MDTTQTVIDTYSMIFINSDARKWSAVRASFADKVFLDYSSLSKSPGMTLDADAIVAAWVGVLPKFKFTMHFLSNHVVSLNGDRATASCYGHAIHHLPGAPGGDFWEVYGTYDVELELTLGSWKVTSLRYNHRYSAGNLELPIIASQGSDQN